MSASTLIWRYIHLLEVTTTAPLRSVQCSSYPSKSYRALVKTLGSLGYAEREFPPKMRVILNWDL
jgi:hypothetical protein